MEQPQQIKVMIVDDHAVVRSGLSAFLLAYPDLQLIGDAASGRDALQLCSSIQPDVILMDLLMPELDGIETTQLIHKHYPAIQVIALTSFWDTELIHRALQAGVIAYIVKNVSPDELAAAIRAAAQKRPTLSSEAARVLMQSAAEPPRPDSALTQREREVLDLMVTGLTNPQIAARLMVSRSTVKFHISNILAKLGVSSRLEAVTLSFQNHMVL